MTTIINFNFLNLFRYKNSQYHFNSLNFNIQNIQDRYKEDIIEVTDYEVITDKLSCSIANHIQSSYKKKSLSGWTYNRKGKSIRYTHPPKGLYIDAFA